MTQLLKLSYCVQTPRRKMCKKLFVGLLLLTTVTVTWAQDSNENADEVKQTTKRPSWSAGLPERTKAKGIDKPEFKSEVDKVELDMSEFGLKTKTPIEIDLPIKSEIQIAPVTSSVAETEEQVLDVSEPELVNEASISQSDDNVESQPGVEQINIEEVVAEEVTIEQPVSELQPVEQEVVEQEVVEADPVSINGESDTATSVTETKDDSLIELEQELVTIPVEQSIAAVEPPITATPDDLSEAASEKMTYEWTIAERADVKYPIKAAKNNLEGWVNVEVTINPAGEVVSATAVDYSRRGRVFGNSAVQSVEKWLFTPPREYGVNTNISKIYKIEFDL